MSLPLITYHQYQVDLPDEALPDALVIEGEALVRLRICICASFIACGVGRQFKEKGKLI